MGLSLIALVLSTSLFATPEFKNLRYDETVPENCREMEISFYQLPPDYFFVGRAGALNMGFTFEYPIARQDATVLWRFFESEVNGENTETQFQKIQNNPNLKRDYEIIERDYEAMGFDFAKEGDILEILAIHQLYQEFPENTYFITGGIEYKHSGHNTLGELDIYVGRRDNCEAVAVGESKLGKKSILKKAKEQLHRFEEFLIENNAPSLGEEYKPRLNNRQLPVAI